MRSPRMGCLGRMLWWRPWPAVVAVGCAMTAVSAEDLAFTTIPPEEYASFLANWDEEQSAIFHGVLRTPQEYAAAFRPAVVMPNHKPCGPPPEFFTAGMLLVVARVIDAPAAGEQPLAVESLTAEGDEIILRYRFMRPASPATSTVKQPLVVRIASRPVDRVRFIENGRPVGDLHVAQGQWAVPQPPLD
ncbi:MAG: hypothetical protein ACKO4T_01830 [Planctomycetaceae bacterium]